MFCILLCHSLCCLLCLFFHFYVIFCILLCQSLCCLCYSFLHFFCNVLSSAVTVDMLPASPTLILSLYCFLYCCVCRYLFFVPQSNMLCVMFCLLLCLFVCCLRSSILTFFWNVFRTVVLVAIHFC